MATKQKNAKRLDTAPGQPQPRSTQAIIGDIQAEIHYANLLLQSAVMHLQTAELPPNEQEMAYAVAAEALKWSASAERMCDEALGSEPA